MGDGLDTRIGVPHEEAISKINAVLELLQGQLKPTNQRVNEHEDGVKKLEYEITVLKASKNPTQKPIPYSTIKTGMPTSAHSNK